jgi:hypothetical protein
MKWDVTYAKGNYCPSDRKMVRVSPDGIGELWPRGLSAFLHYFIPIKTTGSFWFDLNEFQREWFDYRVLTRLPYYDALWLARNGLPFYLWRPLFWLKFHRPWWIRPRWIAYYVGFLDVPEMGRIEWTRFTIHPIRTLRKRYGSLYAAFHVYRGGF